MIRRELRAVCSGCWRGSRRTDGGAEETGDGRRETGEGETRSERGETRDGETRSETYRHSKKTVWGGGGGRNLADFQMSHLIGRVGIDYNL